jgi:uncharacterized protein with HEPN domain
VGMGAWVLRYALFAFGAPDQVFWMIWGGILLHGICYDFFFVTGMVYVEKKASPEIRAQAQGFLVTMTLGVGMFIGMIALGPGLFNWMVEPLDTAERLGPPYLVFWKVPAVLALIVMIGFAILFHDPKVEQEVMEHPPEEGDIAEAAELIQRYIAGVTFESFAADAEKQDAVIRRLEIIGEAVKALPQDFRDDHPSVPWREIAGARDILVHQYFRVDLDLTWAMVTTELPKLSVQVAAILATLEASNGRTSP